MQREGTDIVRLGSASVRLSVKIIVMTSIVEGVDVVMEMDVIKKLGTSSSARRE